MIGLSGYALLVLRLIIGVIFILHGYPLIQDSTALQELFVSNQLPAEAAMAIGYIEVGAGALLLLGLFTSLAGFLLAILTLGAIIMVQAPEAIEAGALTEGVQRHLLLFAGSLVLMAIGPGAWSVRR